MTLLLHSGLSGLGQVLIRPECVSACVMKPWHTVTLRYTDMSEGIQRSYIFVLFWAGLAINNISYKPQREAV